MMVDRAEDVRQLWSLANLLAQQQLTAQTAQCLEPLCAIDCSTRTSEEQDILLRANVLLAEICIAACSNVKKSENRDLWAKRIIQAEKCVYAADKAVTGAVPCSQEYKLRLFKAKFLLQEQIKSERSAKNRRTLEILCEALKSCAETKAEQDVELVGYFKEYFGVKLKACLVKMHAATTSARYAQSAYDFTNNLKYLRNELPNYVDKRFLLWLVEVTCHTAISSFEPGSTAGMKKLVQFGQEFFDKVATEQEIPPDFRVYHLIITGFYHLRTGRLMKVSPLLNEIKTLAQGTTAGDDQKPTGILKETYLNTIVDSMRLSVIACTDPGQALTLAMETIRAAQENLQIYAQHPTVRLMMLTTLFDALHLYCRLLGLQCRYADMGASIAQMTTLFVTYKSELERTIFYRFILARCHTLIAKYATAIGKVKHACVHLNFVVDKVLPSPSLDEATYPDTYLAVWVEVLEAATYCCGVGLEGSSCSDDCSSVQVKQAYPSKKLLDWAARVLRMEGLRHHIHQCCSVDLRTKYDLALAKWLWATQSLSNGNAESVTPYAELEDLRPALFTLLRDSLKRVTTSSSCCETTSEVMALFGPQLLLAGKIELGEETLKNGIGTSLHNKNVLLQLRLLADVFQLYSRQKMTQAQATVAAKYEKKLTVLQRRIAAAQTEQSTALLLEWRAGSQH